MIERVRTRRRKRKGRGKAKGGAFERKVCKQLSLWITDGKMDDCLWRSAISGGRATVAHRKGKLVRQGGDITAVSPEGHVLTDSWYIECKHVKNLGVGQFLIKGTGDLAKFWRKCQKEAARHGDKHPIIIARQNRWPDLVFGHYHQFIVHQPIIKTSKYHNHGINVWLLHDVLSMPFGGINELRDC